MSSFPSPEVLAQMVNSVTQTMMNLKFSLVSKPVDIAAYRRAVLPINGATPVSILVSSDKESCAVLGSRLFMVSPQAVDNSMIEDTLRELANMAGGQVKRAMSLEQALGLPRILPEGDPWRDTIDTSQCIFMRAEGDVHLELLIARHPAKS